MWWRWLTTPSGGPYPEPETPYEAVFLFVMEAPIAAHPLGALVIALYLWPFGLSQFELWWAALGFMVLWQAFNVERLNWHNYGPEEMVPRILLGAVPLGLVLLCL